MRKCAEGGRQVFRGDKIEPAMSADGENEIVRFWLDGPEILTVDDLVRYVEGRDWVTFAELDGLMPALSEGPIVQWVRSPPEGKKGRDLLIWVGGQAGLNLNIKALNDRRLCVAPANLLVYLADGKMLRGVKGIRWVPLCLRPARFGVEVDGLAYLLDRAHAPKKRQRGRVRL
jgi:fermentation-respiration switch protein FrsA (DUF1100 family)